MVVVEDHQQREPSMDDIRTVGLDLAKNVFQVHAIDEAGDVVVRKQLRRRQVRSFFAELSPCLVGLEACATAHHWARELTALGHEVRLMPPNYVKAYVDSHIEPALRCPDVGKIGNPFAIGSQIASRPPQKPGSPIIRRSQ
jgi:hypothetical protein